MRFHAGSNPSLAALPLWLIVVGMKSDVAGSLVEGLNAIHQETTTPVCENPEIHVDFAVNSAADVGSHTERDGQIVEGSNESSPLLPGNSTYNEEVLSRSPTNIDGDSADDDEEEEEEERWNDGSVGAEFGVVQLIEQDYVAVPSVLAKLRETVAYMQEFAANQDFFYKLRGKCWNEEDMCTIWAVMGECEANPKYMKQSCAPACGQCVKPVGAGVEFGVKQRLQDPDGESTEKVIAAKLEETQRYMRDVIWADDFYKSVHTLCFNKEDMCTVWATWGECDKNPLWMGNNCAPACGTCKELHYSTRCAADPKDLNIWGPGDLNRAFERIVAANDMSDFDVTSNVNTTNKDIPAIKVTVLSRPDYLPGDNESTAPYKVGPWIIGIDNFLTPQEADQLVHHGTQKGYAPSTGVGEIDEATGEYQSEIVQERTSTNAWCEEECENDPIVRNVLDRIEAMTGIPRHHSESLQLLKYEVGQFYGTHHDYIEHDTNSVQGPRILTVFMYLNDVEEGGETRFDWFGDDVKLQPKLGRVVLWPSVLDEDPSAIDDRTDHEAMPVLRGRKYGANAWFHLRNYEKGHAMGC